MHVVFRGTYPTKGRRNGRDRLIGFKKKVWTGKKGDRGPKWRMPGKGHGEDRGGTWERLPHTPLVIFVILFGGLPLLGFLQRASRFCCCTHKQHQFSSVMLLCQQPWVCFGRGGVLIKRTTLKHLNYGVQLNIFFLLSSGPPLTRKHGLEKLDRVRGSLSRWSRVFNDVNCLVR